MHIPQTIAYLYPDAVPFEDYIVQDDCDGKGPYIAMWAVKDTNGNPIPQPTEAGLAAAWEELQTLPPVPAPLTDAERITQLEAENAALALAAVEQQIRIDAAEQSNADLLIQLVEKGVL